MKFNYLAALFLMGATLTASAEGYKDGIEYYKAGQLDNAITILTRNMNASGTDKALANYYIGQAYLNKGDYAKAKTYFEKGIAENSACAYNYVGLGALDLLDKNKKAGEANFKEAEKRDKKNSELAIEIARAYYNAGPVTYAKEINKYIEKARKESKNEEPAIYIFEGDRLAYDRNYNDAASQYEMAITMDSDNPAAYVKYADVYYRVDNRRAQEYALKKLEELLEKQPNSALAQRELAEKLYIDGQYTRAAEQYGAYIANPNHFTEDEARYAVLLFADSKYDETVKVAKKVLETTPKDLTMKRVLYRSLVNLNRTEEALDAASDFFGTPEFAGRYNAGDYTIVAQLLSKNNKNDEALALLQEGIKAFPEDANMVKLVSDILSRQDKNIEAFENYLKYMEMTKNPTLQDYNAGSFYALPAVKDAQDEAQKKQFADVGLEYVEKIIEQDPRVNFVLRKFNLKLERNNGKVDADVEAEINNLISILDKDPENANPANSSNYLNTYRVLNSYLVNYYNSIGEKTKALNAKSNFDKYTDLMKSK